MEKCPEDTPACACLMLSTCSAHACKTIHHAGVTMRHCALLPTYGSFILALVPTASTLCPEMCLFVFRPSHGMYALPACIDWCVGASQLKAACAASHPAADP